MNQRVYVATKQVHIKQFNDTMYYMYIPCRNLPRFSIIIHMYNYGG